MDPGLLPLPAACGSDGTTAVSDACGAALWSVCSAGYADVAHGGTLRSMLLNPDSNCSRWLAEVQVANAVAGPSGGSPWLDKAINAYCLGQGSSTAECACVAFPLRAAPYCAAASLTCPALPAAACAAMEFAQTIPDSQALDVVQFTTCNPFACWLADCYAPPQDVLLTGDILATQASGTCAGVCGQVIGSTTDDIAPMPPGSFSVTSNVSGIASCGPNRNDPALIVAEVTRWVWPANARMVAPIWVTNDGDYPAQIAVSSASNDACAVLPGGGGIVFPRSSQQFAITCDQARLEAAWKAHGACDPAVDGPACAPSLSTDAMFEFTYLDLARGTPVTTNPIGVELTIMPPSGPLQNRVTAVRPWFWALLVALVVLAVGVAALNGSVRRSIVELLGAAGVPTVDV